MRRTPYLKSNLPNIFAPIIFDNTSSTVHAQMAIQILTPKRLTPKRTPVECFGNDLVGLYIDLIDLILRFLVQTVWNPAYHRID